ncbi:MAG: hypothetical protein V3S40_11380 [Kiloniellales bacterium]
MSHELSITVEREGQHFIESSVEPGKVLEGPFSTQEEADRRAESRSLEFPGGSALFGRADLFATARRAPAPGPPSDFSESLRSSFNVTMEVGRSISDDKALRDTYQEYLDEVQELSGKAIPNPQHPGVLDQPKAEAMVLEQVRKLREKFPDIPLRTPEDIRAGIGRDRALARETRAEVARREIGFGANAGAFLGTAGAIMTDPPVFASMFFGAPWATGLLRAGLIEAAAVGAGETLAQIGIQTGRRQFGEEPDIGEAVASVAIAAAGAGVLAPVVRGGAAGVRALLKRGKRLPVRAGSLAKAAERFLRRQVELEDASPFNAAPAARAEHAARLTEAQVALRESRPARMAETPRAAVREDVASRRGPAPDFGDDELGRLALEVAEMTLYILGLCLILYIFFENFLYVAHQSGLPKVSLPNF